MIVHCWNKCWVVERGGTLQIIRNAFFLESGKSVKVYSWSFGPNNVAVTKVRKDKGVINLN